MTASTLAPTSPVIASAASSSDVGRTSAVCPRPFQRLHSFSVKLTLICEFLATSAAPRHWGTTFGGFGAAAIVTGSRGRATTVFVGPSTAWQ